MGNYKRTIINEDGSKMTIADPSLTENITLYTIQDKNEKRGFYSLSEADKLLADNLLLGLKLTYYSFNDNLNDNSKDEIYKEVIELVKELTQDENTRKYLKKNIDILFETGRLTFDDIKKDLDCYSTESITDIIEEYVTQSSSEESEKITEITNSLLEYLEERKKADSLMVLEENEEFNEKLSFTEKHPKITGFGKFLKNSIISVGGFIFDLPDDQIEQLKQDNVTDFVEDLVGVVDAKSFEVAEKQAKIDAKIEKKKENRALTMTYEYRKAFKKRGLDYDKLYGNTYNADLDYYLKTINMSKEEYYQILSEIKAEVNSIMKHNGY